MNARNRVLVGMSGGSDSTAACLMLMEKGFEVVGFTMMNTDDGSATEAEEMAKAIGVEHHVVDVRKEFKESIVQYFIDEYMRGRTPNPCVLCNATFKERLLAEYADRYGCTMIATGHYCRIVKQGEIYYVARGRDEKKDQSYFLWRLPQHILSRLLFPLGNYTKKEVRHYLMNKGFPVPAEKRESMEICFVPFNSDYRSFLRSSIPNIETLVGEGKFVDKKGVPIGQHEGYPFYTIGQRKGLHIALGEPAYVLRINPEKNTVMLGSATDLMSGYMLVDDVVAPSLQALIENPEVKVRIRYHGEAVPCKLHNLSDGQLLVQFQGKVSAISPGQSAVFYWHDCVVGGAVISSQRGVLRKAAEILDVDRVE